MVTKIKQKLIAIVLILSLVLPISVFATVAELSKDTTEPGISYAIEEYKAKEVDYKISLTEDKLYEIEIPIGDDLSENDIKEIEFSLLRDETKAYLDPAKYPYAWEGGELSEWKDMNDQKMFKVESVEVDKDKKVLKVTLNGFCYFYSYNRRTGIKTKDYSVPHVNYGPYLDICGYFNFIAKLGEKELGEVAVKVVPYESFRTVYEIYETLDEIAERGNGNFVVQKRSMGFTTKENRDMTYLVVAKSEDAINDWLAYTELSETDPDKVLKKIKAGKYDKLKVPILVCNCHPNENSANCGIVNFADILTSEENIIFNKITGLTEEGKERIKEEEEIAGTTLSKLVEPHTSQFGRIRGDDKAVENQISVKIEQMEEYYHIDKEHIEVSKLLDDVFFIIAPTMNPVGYENQIRAATLGMDPNRDEANQVMYEDANFMAMVNKWNPMVYDEVHGRVLGLLVEPCTPPHEPNFEYDLVAKQFIQLGEALGAGGIANNDKFNSFQMPIRDYLRQDENTDTGSAWSIPWDDMTTAFGSQYPVLIGTCGITWEMPAYDETTASKVIPYGMFGQGLYVQEHKKDLLKTQAKLFRRGLHNYNSNEKVKKYYVNQYDEQGQQLEIMRPVYDGEGENGNFYPECFIIPLDKGHQRNIEDAAAALKYLTRNDIKVKLAKEAFYYKGIEYPTGTMIVSMYQAKRSLAHSQLFKGTFINVWKKLYSESFAQQPYARGYDIITVAEPKEYEKIIKICGSDMDYNAALKFLGSFDSQFNGIEGADVIIENASADATIAVNELLNAGKKVGLILEGSDKGDFICSYDDYLSIANKYVLMAEGVYGADYKAALIKEAPKVFLTGKPALPTAGCLSIGANTLYNFDKLALDKLGFVVLGDANELGDADVIVGSLNASKEALVAVKLGIPYMVWGNAAKSLLNEKGLADTALEGTALESAKVQKCKEGTDMLGVVEYPFNSFVNSSYINEGDKIMYQYGTNWFAEVPEGAKVIVKNAGEKPLQGCIAIYGDSDLQAEFDTYNNGALAFEYTMNGLDIVAFANTLTHKGHQTDEYTFISNFIWSRMIDDTAYTGEQAPVKPVEPVEPVAPVKPVEPVAPETGDQTNMILWMYIALLAFGGYIVSYKIYRKRNM